jgi:hypothetical protein
MHAAFYSTLAVVAWIAAAYRLSALRRHTGTPARYAVISALALLAVTFTVSVPSVWSALDRITGVNNIAALVAHLCVVGFSTVVQVLLVWWASPAEIALRRSRPRLFFLGSVAAVLLCLFVTAGPTESHSTDFVATYTSRPSIAVYLVTYLVAFGTGLVDIVRLCWPYSRLVDRGSLRLGLRTTAVGAGIGLLYCAARGLDIVGVAAGWDVRQWEFLVPLSSSTGALLVIAGLTMPAWGPRVSAAARIVRTLRTYRALNPLWMAMCEAVPSVRLSAVDGQVGSLVRLNERLHRRVVEIYDGRLALRPYLDEAVGDEARRRGEIEGLTGQDLAAVIEAAKLKGALAQMRTEGKPQRPERPASPDVEVDEAREVEQLARVARAFVDSAIIASMAETAADVRTTRQR